MALFSLAIPAWIVLFSKTPGILTQVQNHWQFFDKQYQLKYNVCRNQKDERT